MAVVLQRPAVLNNIKSISTCSYKVVVVSSRFISSEEGTTSTTKVKPLQTTKLTSLKRGTGGRSSFSGVVATVFGASGFTARAVVNKLGKLGTQVICPYRGDYYNVRPLKLAGDLGQIQFLPFDLNDEESIYKALKYSNVVINLIGRDNPTWNFSFDDVHVQGARRLARIAREAGVERFIHLSALNASEKPQPAILKEGSQFLKSKWRGELAVREEFPEAIIFRPSDIYGPGDRFLSYYASWWRNTFHTLPLWKKGVGVIKQPVYVSDVAKGITNSVFDPNAVGKIYQAVGPRRYELSELVDFFYRSMRKTADWNYRRTDMRYDLLFRVRVNLTEKIMRVKPQLCWERLERDHVSDVVSEELPTLEDLGVTLNTVEERAPWDLRIYRAHNDYMDELGEFDEPYPPPVVPAQN